MQTTIEPQTTNKTANTRPRKTPILDATIQDFVDALTASGAPPVYTLSPTQARQFLADAQAGPVTKPDVDIEDRTIPVGPKGVTRIRVLRPQGNRTTLPVVMYFHGAGWVMGDVNTHDRLVREIVHGTQSVVVFVDYDRSPESQYPVAVEEDYAATLYVAEHAAEFNVDVSRLAIAGDSVGGNMTAVVALLAKQRGGPRICAQVLFYPVTDAGMDNASYREFENGPFLTKAAMKWFWDAYLPDAKQRKHPTVSPLQASIEDLKGLPPALVITNECDVLRDEGEAYARKLMQAGVRVTATRYLGAMHDLVMLNGITHSPVARAAIAQANEFLRHALSH